MKNYKLTVLKGDGIGPEIVDEAIKALDKAADKFGFSVEYDYQLLGGAAIDATGVPLPEETVNSCKAADSVILGAVGGPKWDSQPGNNRPEAGLLGIRKALGLYANLRPAVIFAPLRDASPLKPEIIGESLDLMVVRELTAQKRGHKLTSVDKANVLDSSRLWRATVDRIAAEYPDVQVSHLYVDNTAMQLVRDPGQFDVILTSNMFGDILSDEASMISGSIGMLASASLGGSGFGLYEPIHGSAPDIAGQDAANPLATILSIAMLLKYSLDEPQAAKAIEDAVAKALTMARTRDIYTEGCGAKLVGCREMGDIVASLI